MEGLVKFREAFAEYSENYVVIGGAACDITMTNTVVRPRATHDIDMIVIVENMTEAFANRFWQFVREAGYRPEKRKQEAGEPPRYEMYRFLDGTEARIGCRRTCCSAGKSPHSYNQLRWKFFSGRDH